MRGLRRRGLPGQRYETARADAPAGGKALWPTAVAHARAGSLRPGGAPQAADQPVQHWGGRVVRQGYAVARAAGPRHRYPRLRYEAHRRGAASAASRPPQARARAVIKVGLSAQRSADRSVQRRSHGHCTAGLPPPCAGLPGDVLAPHRLGNALEQTLRLASPHRPPRGTAGSTGAAGGKQLRRSYRCPSAGFHSPCQASQCTAAGLLHQDPLGYLYGMLALVCAPASIVILARQ